MKEENYKPVGFLVAIVLLAFGLIFLGRAGINAIDSESPIPQEGEMLSLRMTALIQFLFGLIAVVVGILLYFILQKRKTVFEE